MSRRSLRILAVCLLLGPPALLWTALIPDWITASTAGQTLTGMGITAIGGLLAGIISERFLKRGRNGTEQTAGLIAVTALSVITIGIFYILHIRGPMSSIGTPERAVKQLLGFTEFLTAQGAGIMLSASRSVV